MMPTFKFKMQFPIFLIVLFFIGIEVNANPADRCTQTMIHNGFDSVINLDSEQQFNIFCGNMTVFFNCLNDVMRESSGLNIKQAAVFLRRHPIGKALQMLVNVDEFINELCTEGSELNEGYLASMECFQNVSKDPENKCEEQARNASQIFRELQDGRGGQMPTDEMCVNAAYHMGCTGTKILEKCGDEGFHIFKEIVKKVGIFKSGVCSPDVMEIIKTTLIDRLDMSDSNKILYTAILNLRRRRK